MDKIGSVYRIIKRIGSGGGGIVYIAYHKGLEKYVILKEDRKGIYIAEEEQRREVDVLKELKNPYIPQVYDFFVEGNKVYTVMEYIDGESLEKPLKRGTLFSIPDIIKWSIQILRALSYIHERGYVHSDIKPANLMRRENGDICLIDFNIAVSLGATNFAGISEGYSSPEHYGQDFSSYGTSDTQTQDNDATESMDSTLQYHNGETTVPFPALKEKYGKRIRPDIRSDIYMVGATLYHLLCGSRPAKDARDVVVLSKGKYNEQIVDIITKAMCPNPDFRYQTAEEMLHDFLSVRYADKRSVRLKKQISLYRSITLSLLIVGIFCTLIGMKRIQTRETWLKLIGYAKEAKADGDADRALAYVMKTIPRKTGFINRIVNPRLLPDTRRELTNILCVYDLRDCYEGDRTVELSSAPFALRISPNGQTISCLHKDNLSIIDVSNGKILETLQADGSALSEVEYLNDDTVIYAGRQGVTAYSIRDSKYLWEGKPGTAIAVSDDGSTVAAVYRDEEFATIYNAATGVEKGTIDFIGKSQSVVENDIFLNPNDNLFELNSDGSELAISFSDGSAYIIPINGEAEGEIEISDGKEGFFHFEGGFSGDYFAYGAMGNGNYSFQVFDLTSDEVLLQMHSNEYYTVMTDAEAIYLGEANKLVEVLPETGEQRPLVKTSQVIDDYVTDGKHTMIAGDDSIEFYDANANILNTVFRKSSRNLIDLKNGVAVAGCSDSPVVGIYKYITKKENDFGKYDKDVVHEETRVCADKEHITIFNFEGFSTYTVSGKKEVEISIPNSESLYDQQFLRENGKSLLEVTYRDGHVVYYDAVTGEVSDEKEGVDTDETLLEEFETENYRIESPLHGTPVVYDKKNNRIIKKLSSEDYLTYVTEMNGYIVAQYMSIEKGYYGLLMNRRCEVIGEIPNLCDVYDGMLYVDDGNGRIRCVKIYEWNELIELAYAEK